MMQKLCFAILTMWFVAGLSGATLVKDHRPCAAIVLPDKPPKLWHDAAEDFQYHVEKMTGARLPVVEPGAPVPEGLARILLGKNDGVELDSLGRNGFVLRTEGADLVIAGRGEGPVQALYYLLEDVLGVRWLWPGELGEVIPERADLVIGPLDIRFRQPLSSSRIHPMNTGRAGWQDEAAWKAFNAADLLWVERHGFSWDTSLCSQHAFGHPLWQYGAKYMKTHPEFFNLLPDGTRRPDPYHVNGAVEYCSTCPSSEALLQQVLADWKAKRNSGIPAFGPNLHLGENDTLGSCCCPECLAADHSDDPDRLSRARKRFLNQEPGWAKELGSVTERYAAFYLRGLAEAQKTDPNVKVIGWAAYSNYYEAPRYNKLNPNIVVAFVGRVMYPWTPEKIAEFKRCWMDWRQTGATMLLRPNFMLDGHCMPVNFARKLYDLLQFCLANGMIGTEYDSDIGQFGGNGFNYYVMARLTRNPTLSFAEIQTEYCQGFGAAAEDVRHYLDYWEKISDSQATVDACNAVRRNPIGVEVGSWNYFYTKAPLVYTPAVFAAGKAFLDEGARHAAGDARSLRRLEFLRQGLRNAELTCQAQRVYEQGDGRKTAEAVRELDEYRRTIEPGFVANMNHLTKWENMLWDRGRLTAILSELGTPLPAEWRFAFDPDDIGLRQQWFAESFAASDWRPIGIDTGWELQPPGREWRAQHGADYDGAAWYRLQFAVAPAQLGRRATLTFGAVDESCTIWLNGQKVLERPFPYQGDANSWMTPFHVEVSPFLRANAPNLLVVRVMDTMGQGGIWRPVWLHFDAPPNPHSNLLADGDFESTEADCRKVWLLHRVNGTFDFGLDTAQPHSGSQSWRMTCTALNPGGRNAPERAWMRIYQTVPVAPGARFELRAAYRTTPKFAGQVRIWLRGKGIEKEFIGYDTQGAWQEMRLEDLRIPEGTTSVMVYLNVWGDTGTVWFDDVELKDAAPQ